jgi:lipopolysaccharide export system protein LptC
MQTRFSSLPSRSANDRAKAFRNAKRHSALVKLLRFALPCVAIVLSGLYLIPNKVTVKVEGGEASIESIELSQGGLKMVNPRINGVHEKHGVYDIRADDATQHIKNPELITLNNISAKLTSKANENTLLTADSGVFHSKKEELSFTTDVIISGNAGFAGKLKSATAFLQANKLISTEPVEFSFRSSTISAGSMTFFSSDRRVLFEGGVKVHLKRTPEANGK